MKHVLNIAALLTIAVSLTADDRVFTVPHVDAAITVDGILNDPAWERALVLDLGVEFSPGENIPAPVRTEVLLCSGSGHFFVAFRAFDPDPSAIRARFTDRDQLGAGDWVSVVLDTFNDARRSFNFSVNPLGIQGDMVKTTTGNESPEWDAIWDSAGRIVDDGYIVEIAIPFSSLRFQSSDGPQLWGFDAIRVYPRKVTHQIGIVPRDRSDVCTLCQVVHIEGFAGADPGRNLEFSPTLSALATEERTPFPDGPFTETNSALEAGLTARWGVTPNLNLSTTINPDFSQIEADAAQLDINTQFTLFYPEKRPFFLEGTDFFQTALSAIYTRTLSDPEWGIKAAGKVGKGALGFYTVRDSVTNILFPDTESSATTSLNSPSTATVLRYRRDVGRSSTVGGLITDRQGDDGYFNRVYGADFDLHLTTSHLLQFQVLESETRYPGDLSLEYRQPEGSFSGRATYALYMWHTRTHEVYAKVQHISPEFRSDLGFIPQAGFTFYDTGYLHTWQQNDPDHWYNRIRTWVGYERTEDADGRMLRSVPGAFFMYYGPHQGFVYALVYYGDQTFLGKRYPDRNLTLNSQINLSADVQLNLNLLVGDRVDFEHARIGKRLRLAPGLQFFSGKRLHGTLSLIHETFDVDPGRLYAADLSELKTVYQFNRRAFIRLILQYADYDYNTRNYARPRAPEFKHLLTQLLFTYKVDPQTALYLGYSDNHQGDSQIDLTQLNRTAFFKIGYAWVP